MHPSNLDWTDAGIRRLLGFCSCSKVRPRKSHPRPLPSLFTPQNAQIAQKRARSELLPRQPSAVDQLSNRLAGSRLIYGGSHRNCPDCLSAGKRWETKWKAASKTQQTLIRLAGSDSTNAAQCGELGIPKLTAGIREQAVRSTVIEHSSMRAAVN